MRSPDSPHTKLRIFNWTLFDFANTAFSVIVVTVIYSRYFTDQVAGGQRWLWGLSVSISMLLTAILSPPLGAMADSTNRRKLYLMLFTAASIICTACLYFVQEGMILLGMILFIIANIGFEGGIVFYDAFLPTLTTQKTYGRVSGYGFAMGYLGALAVLVIVYIILPDSTNPDYFHYVRISYLIAALFFLIFSLPLFLTDIESQGTQDKVASYFYDGFRQAKNTFVALFKDKQFKQLGRFLAAFFTFNNGISTVIVFASLFAADTLHLSDNGIIVFFTVIQTSAIAGSVFFGIVTDKIGPKSTISITLALWIVIIVGAYFVQSIPWFYVIGLAAGIAMGASQAASRSLMALLTPKDREAEFFGFYNGLCGKASAIMGPLIYGIVADITTERTAIAMVGIFFLLGLLILRGVKEPGRNNTMQALEQ
jgi:MFS transporter, UMF1 family